MKRIEKTHFFHESKVHKTGAITWFEAFCGTGVAKSFSAVARLKADQTEITCLKCCTKLDKMWERKTGLFISTTKGNYYSPAAWKRQLKKKKGKR